VRHSIALVLAPVLLAGLAAAEPMSRARQEEIIDAYLYITGRAPAPAQALGEGVQLTPDGAPIVKCGMAVAADLLNNRSRIDKELLQAAGIDQSLRPVLRLEETLVSPDQRFKVHYTRVGDSAVILTDNNGNSIPDYVEATAVILDSVHHNIVGVLGYPAPPRDDFYAGGGDSLYDVYLLDIGAGAYGYTQPEELTGPESMWATSFMALDRNYDGLPDYAGRPLDAIRVTAAHEYFHAVQFALDYFEGTVYLQPTDTVVARYWMEMSSVWMEEKLYDDINDYYNYLPYFFADPRLSLQQFNSYYDLQPYANGICPIFLEQYYDDTLIYAIWKGCEELGPGPDFLTAANAEIDTFTAGAQQWPQAMREFRIWNWFTGTHADPVPQYVGYEERQAYPELNPARLMRTATYPDTVPANDNPLNPLHNGAAYILLDSTKFVPPDTTYWNCTSVLDSACTDSTEVPQTADWDFFRIGCVSRDTTYWVCNSWSDSVCGGRVRRSVSQDWDFSIVKCSTIVNGIDTSYVELLPRYYKCTLWVDTRCDDSVQVDGQSGYDWITIDSTLRLDLSLGSASPPLPQPWGIAIMYYFVDYPDSVEIDRFTLLDGSVTRLLFPNPDRYSRILVALSPATYSQDERHYRTYPSIAMRVGYLAAANLVPPEPVPVKPAVWFYPYPNPVNPALPNHTNVAFRFTVPFGEYGEPETTDPEIVVDLFTVAGERVRTLSGAEPVGETAGMYEVHWDLRNDAGRDVVSGAYVAVARLYESSARKRVLAESTTKVAVIR